MSSKRRRIRRKIERMVKLDAQARRYWRAKDIAKAQRMYWTMIKPIGVKLRRMGHMERSKAAIERARSGLRP